MGVLPQVPDSQVTTTIDRRPHRDTLRHQRPSGWRPIQSLHQGPTQKSPRTISAIREVRQIRRATSAKGRVLEKAQGPSTVQPNLDQAFAVRLRTGQPQSAAGAQHSQPAPDRRGRSPLGISPWAAVMTREGGARDGRSNHTDFTACSTVKIAHTQQEIARKQRPPGTGCLEHNQPTTRELSCTHTTTNNNNHTTTATSSIHPTTHISIIRKYKLFHPRLRLHITRTHITKITPSTKAGRLHRAAISRSHPHDHLRVHHRLRNEAAEEGSLPECKPRCSHRPSGTNEVVTCATNLRRQRCQSAQRTSRRHHGDELQCGRLGPTQSPG
jgi:hypothetical protein